MPAVKNQVRLHHKIPSFTDIPVIVYVFHLLQKKMKKIFLLILAIFPLLINAHAQKIKAGIYAGLGFATEKSDYLEVGVLPITKGGMNAHYGIHINFPVGNRIEAETGLQKVTHGYTYTPNTAFDPAEYTKIQCVSAPVIVLYHILNYPDEAPFRMSVGLGIYGSYAVSGKITYEDGTSKNAGFSNVKRMELGPKWMMKWEFVHKFQCYLSSDIKSTNIIKNGSGYIKQGSFQAGLGYVF